MTVDVEAAFAIDLGRHHQRDRPGAAISEPVDREADGQVAAGERAEA